MPDADFDRVAKYVRRAPTLLLPTGWREWGDGHLPREHKLPLDEELARLSRKGMLSSNEVRARHSTNWPSHEVAIRCQLTWYTNIEFQDGITHAAEEARIARRQLQLLSTSRESLDKYLSLAPTDTEIRSATELVRKAQAKVSSKLHACRPREGGKPAQNWKAWFVFRLAAFWYIVMGKQPSSSPDSAFADLVDAAWNSLHQKIPEIKWDTFVRRFAKSADLKEARETAFLASLCAHRIWRP